MERMQDGLKKLNIRVRQQTKTLEEKVSNLKIENTQLKTANAEKEGQLQSIKNQHQSLLDLKSNSRVSSTQPTPPVSIAPNKQVVVIKPSKPITTIVVNPIPRDQLSVSVPPSLVTSSAQPSSSLPPTLPTVSSDWPKHPSSGQGNTPTTNFNLSHVQQQDPQQSGVTTRSGSKRRREEFDSSTSDPQGKKKIVVTTPPLDSSQLPTSMGEGTSLIDSSTAHSPNSTYGNPPIIEETSSSHLQVVPSSGDDLLQPSQIYSELSPSIATPPRLLLPPSFENFGEIEHAVPNTPILQPGIPISGQKETEFNAKAENCKKFAQVARTWKTRFEEKNSKFQEIEKTLNELKTSNLQEKSRSEEEWQERQQELTDKNQGLENEKTSLQEQLNETKAALEEKSRKMERMQDGLKKLNIRVRQQTKTLEEKVSNLKIENTQLKTANAEKEGQLQSIKNQHQSLLDLKSNSRVSSTQPTPPVSIAPNKQVVVIKPSKPITTIVVNPIPRDQLSVSVPPSLVTSSAQPSSSLPPTLPTVSSDWPKHPSSGQGNTPTTNFNLSHVQQQDPQQSGVTTRSGSKRRREEFDSSTSDPQGKKKIVVTTPPLDSSQLPTSMGEGTSLIDSSTAHSPNSTYGNPPIIEETSSSHLQVVPSSGDDLLQPSQIYSELSPSIATPPRLLLPPSFENFGEIEHAVPNTPILQPGIPISGHSSTGHSVPVPPDSSSVNVISDEGLTNDHELDFCMGHEIIHDNSSQEDNLYGDFPTRSVDVHITSPNHDLPFSTNADSPSSTPGPQVSTSTHNQTSLSTHQEEALIITDDGILPETSEIPTLQTETEEPTSAADVIARSKIADPTEGVTCIEIPHELSYEQLSSSDEGVLDREEHTTVISSDESESDVYGKGGSIESVSDGELEIQLPQPDEFGDSAEPTGSLPESSSKSVAEPKYVPIKWSGTPTGSAHPSLKGRSWLGEVMCTSTERVGKSPYRLSSWLELSWMISCPIQKSSSWSFVSPSSDMTLTLELSGGTGTECPVEE